MKKAIKIAAVALLVVLVFTGAAYAADQLHRRELEPVTLYSDGIINVSRTGRITTILDVGSGREYVYTTRRIKKPQSAAETAERARAKLGTDTDSIKIETVYTLLIITEKATGDVIYIR